MIAIDDVQLTPERVPVGGNYLLRVKCSETGGELTPVPVVHVDITYAPADVYTGQRYSCYVINNGIEIASPSVSFPAGYPQHMLWTVHTPARAKAYNADDFITLTAGQYRAAITLQGFSTLAGVTRETTATLYAADGAAATTASVMDTQMGEDAAYTLVMDGLAIAADGSYRLQIDTPAVAGAKETQFCYGFDLYRMEAST